MSLRIVIIPSRWTDGSGVSSSRSETLHLPVDTDVIDSDTTLGQQFLNIPVGQAVP
jgi:hypothetical protein